MRAKASCPTGINRRQMPTSIHPGAVRKVDGKQAIAVLTSSSVRYMFGIWPSILNPLMLCRMGLCVAVARG